MPARRRKACRCCGKVITEKSAKYGKSYDDELQEASDPLKLKFPAIVFNDELSSEKALSCEPVVSYLNNNEIDFRISFDESDNEDNMVIFDKNSFSYKIISVNDLKTDSENDNEKVNMPLFSSPEPMVSYFDDLDFLKNFENGFPTIVYNDALTFKSDSSTKPVKIPQHINEFNLVKLMIIVVCEMRNKRFLLNDYPFNIIYPDDLKSDKDNDDNKTDIIQSSGDMDLLPRDQTHQYLRDYSTLMLISHILRRRCGWSTGMLRDRVYSLAELGGGYLRLEARWYNVSFLEAESARQIPDKGDLSAYWAVIAYSIARRSQAPEKLLRLDAPEAVKDALVVDKGAPAIPVPAQAPPPPAWTMA
ncbi:hypothetical protein Tco_1394140 [Tanacetum coccineum]